MTTEFANYFWDLDNEYIGYKLQDFAKKYGAKQQEPIWLQGSVYRLSPPTTDRTKSSDKQWIY